MRMESVHRNRFATAVRVACLTLTCVGLAPMWANATIYWEDGLDVGKTGYVAVAGMNFDSSVVAYGTHSLHLHFPSVNVQAGTYTDREFPSTPNVYSRFYFRVDNFTVANETKVVELTSQATGEGPSYWWNMSYGNPALEVHAQYVVFSDGTVGTSVYRSNTGNAGFQNGRWYCVELHIQHNTPGVADGLIEAWKDGEPILYYPNLILRQATRIGGNDPNRQFSIQRLYAQYGQGEMYFDNMAVGNQRIGCSGAPPQITPIPPAPQPTVPALVPPPAPHGLYIR